MERIHHAEVFIKRPHAVEEFKSRAGFPPSFDEDQAHDVMKDLVMSAFNENQERLTNVRNSDKMQNKGFCFRLHPEGRQVVYACITYGHSEGRYTYMIHTVLSQDMYQSWSREGKLGTMADKAGESLIAVRDQIRKQTAETKEAEKMADEHEYFLHQSDKKDPIALKESEIDKVVVSLLKKGVKLTDITLYKKVPLNIKINIGEL